jgi:hypothetical protein
MGKKPLKRGALLTLTIKVSAALFILPAPDLEKL